MDRNGVSLHPEALDRLDYFVDQLARRGIYTNLNLHVGRVHSRGLGLPQADEGYDKMVSIFMPELIEAQKTYARALLTRTNPYRGMTYAEDYAVAIAEITNENSLFIVERRPGTSDAAGWCTQRNCAASIIAG